MDTLTIFKAISALLLRTALIWELIVVSILAIHDFAVGVSLSDDKLLIFLSKPLIWIALNALASIIIDLILHG